MNELSKQNTPVPRATPAETLAEALGRFSRLQKSLQELRSSLIEGPTLSTTEVDEVSYEFPSPSSALHQGADLINGHCAQCENHIEEIRAALL